MPHRHLGEGGDQGAHEGHPGGGAFLGNGPGGDVDVDVGLVKLLQGDAEAEGVLLGVGEGGPGRLLHHVAELPGEDEVALAGHHGDLHEHDVPAHGGVVHPRGHPHLGLPGLGLGEEAGRAEVGLQVLLRDPHPLLALLQDPAGGLAEEGPDLPLQLPHPRLPGVVGDEAREGGLGHHHLLGLEAVFL